MHRGIESAPLRAPTVSLSFAARIRRDWIRYAIPGVALLLLLAGGAAAAVEADTVGSFGQGIYWALALISTVGFVGHPPATVAGEVLSAILMTLGFVLLAVTTAAIASLFVREDERPEQRRERAFERQLLAEVRALHERLDALEDARTPAGRPG